MKKSTLLMRKLGLILASASIVPTGSVPYMDPVVSLPRTPFLERAITKSMSTYTHEAPAIGPVTTIDALALTIAGVCMAGLIAVGWHVVSARAPQQQVALPEDIVDLDSIVIDSEVKACLLQYLDLLVHPQHYAAMKLKAPKGILLYGPPGNGKTHIARACAGQLRKMLQRQDVQFMSISATELQQSYVGASSKNIRDLFAQARKAPYTIIFIDELDAIGMARDRLPTYAQPYMRETLNQLLVELDGFQHLNNVLVIGATNTPEVLDGALIRAGRLSEHIEIPQPNRDMRTALWKLYLERIDVQAGIDYQQLADMTNGYSCADIAEAVNAMARAVARQGRTQVTQADLVQAVLGKKTD